MALTSFTALPMGSLQFNAAKEIQLSMSKQSQEGYDLRDCCRNKQTDRLDTNPWLSTAESYVVLKIAKNPW